MIRRGLTLAELTISLALLGLIAVVAVNIYVSAGQLSKDELLRIDVGASANRALSTVDRLIRQGRSVMASAVDNSVTYTTGDTTLVLTAPSIVGGATTATSDTIIVFLDATDPSNGLLKAITVPYVDADPAKNSTRPGGTSILASGVKDVFFRYNDADPTLATAVTVSLRTTGSAAGKTRTQATLLYATLRNHP